ncbi:hypothetical protein [Bradyrhizobium yuanmingense]|uniref:hypothetical protein n=1 Tax=Bradyrhizobium yuanmingense TaxID=108015 RepID=UPI000A982953|nr:hypothetical protein [Bradyrhizobium yuanmingense]
MTEALTLHFEVIPRQAVDELRRLIDRTHYQSGKTRGEFLGCYADKADLKRLAPDFAFDESKERVAVGAAVLQQGCSYANPRGRRHLAAEHFPKLKLDLLARNVIVQRMGLALISRVAVEPGLQGLGIGTNLALACRRQASILYPGTRFVEVMTSRTRHEWEQIKKQESSGGDFLRAAGFRLAPFTTRAKNPKERGGRDRVLYYWAPVL